MTAAPEYTAREASHSRDLRALRGPFATATAMAAVMALPGYALAGPQNGSVAQGSATISQSGATTTINQSSNRAVINWQGFSVGASETVNFNQPGVTSATLNRVTGNDQSVINGALNANGQVFIVNQNGVLFGKGAQVNVGGLTASTLNITDSNFMAGNYVFQSSSAASVVNHGKIKPSDGGYVALLGKTVSNDGVIVATLGTVAMASGTKITLNFDGNSLIDVTIDEGALNALVENKKAIKADGGKVILTAKAADAILSAQVNNSGIIQARTMAQLKGGGSGTARKGSIKLLAQGGTTNVSGKLDASAPKGGDGGFIETSGDKVNVSDSAVITTKAANGVTGTWLIDPNDFTIAASGGDMTGAAVANALANNNFEIATATQGTPNGHGDIFVNDAIVWGSPTTLTLTAERNVTVNSAITANGAGAGLVVNAGAGGITINAAVGPAATATAATFDVTLNAPGDGGFININAPLTVTTLAMTVPAAITFNLPSATQDSPPVVTETPTSFDIHGNYAFGSNGAVNFTAAGTNALTINSQDYTLITSREEIETIDGAGNYALARNLDLGGKTYSSAVIADISGTLAGLGHTISNLTIVDLATGPGGVIRTDTTNTALVGSIESGAVVRDINLTNVNINNPDNAVAGMSADDRAALLRQGGFGVGGIAGFNDGAIFGVSVSTDSAGYIVGGAFVGGVAGVSSGSIINSHANVNVLAWEGSAGGLVGQLSFNFITDQVVINSSSAGTVTNNTLIAATGNAAGLPGGVGGLVGSTSFGGSIYNSTSSSTVVATDSVAVGGLVGDLQAGFNSDFTAPAGGGIFNSSASGPVTLTNTHPVGTGTSNTVSGVGGLVGVNEGGVLVGDSASGAVTASATGLLSGNGGPFINGVGGLIGYGDSGILGEPGIIDGSSATGPVTATGSISGVGGFVGVLNAGLITRSSAGVAVTTHAGDLTLDGVSSPVVPGSVGGFAGLNNFGSISNSTSVGHVSADPGRFGVNVGGFVGANSGTLNGNTFDGARSGQHNGVGGRGDGGGVTRFIDPAIAAGVGAGNVAQSIALTTATSPSPSGNVSAAGTPAASGSPASAAVSASLSAVQDSIQAGDRRAQRRPRVATAAPPPPSRRPALGGSIRELQITPAQPSR